MTGRRRAGAAAGLLVAIILALTLHPVPVAPGSTETIPASCLICGSRGTADALLNLFLFLPLGAALAASGWRLRWVVVGAAILSASIETLQLGLAGRYGVLGDVVWNTTGAALGGALVHHAAGGRAWVRRHRRVTGSALMALPVLVAAASGWLLLPAPQRAAYYGQWTADLGGSLAVYDGRVLRARIGGRPGPSGRLDDAPAARAAILAGAPIRLRFVAGTPPSRLAPIFSVYDDRQHEVLLLGARGDDVVLRIRRHAAGARLDQPNLRWRAALAGAPPGDTVDVSLRRSGPWAFTLSVNSRARAARADPRRGWALLAWPADAPAAVRAAGDATWVLLWIGVLAAGVMVFSSAQPGIQQG